VIDSRVLALSGLHTRRDLIAGQVDYDHLGRRLWVRNISVSCFLSIANSFGLWWCFRRQP
jgi:hypothetical protein